MSGTDLARLTADLQSDPTKKAEVDRVAESPESLVDWAREHGYALSLEEASGLSASAGELTMDELEQVAGGWDGPEPPPNPNAGGG